MLQNKTANLNRNRCQTHFGSAFGVRQDSVFQEEIPLQTKVTRTDIKQNKNIFKLLFGRKSATLIVSLYVPVNDKQMIAFICPEIKRQNDNKHCYMTLNFVYM